MNARNVAAPTLFIAATAIFAAILACLAASAINTAYYRVHPFIGDTSSFFYVQFKLYFDSVDASKTKVIWDQFLANPKNPLGYFHHLFFRRSFLLSMNSHLVFTGIALATFSTFLGWAVYQRTGSMIYGAIAPFIIFCAEGLFEPIYRLPSKLSDPPAALIFGSAVLCVVNSRQGRSLPWLAAFGLFAGLTLLSRFTSSGYLFFVCAPILMAFFWLRWRDSSHGLKHVAWSIAVIAVPLIAVAGWHFLTHVRGVLLFYSVASYVFNLGILVSIEQTLIGFFATFFGGLGLAWLTLIGAVYTVMFWHRRGDLIDLFVTIWIAVAVPILICGIFQVVGDDTHIIYGLAGYLLLALAPFPIVSLSQEESRRLTSFAAVVALSLIPATADALLKRPYRSYVHNINPHDRQIAIANRKMSEYALIRQREQKREQVIDASYDYHWRHLQPTALYAFGILLRTERQFEIRKEQWTMRYGEKSPETLVPLLTANYDRNTDILYLLANPTSDRARPLMNDDFTAAMAQGILDWVRAAPGWTKLGNTENRWGVIEVWANGNRR